jgi:hypothetical protein
MEWEEVEEIRKAIPPRPPTGSLGSGVWDEGSRRFEQALKRYEFENGVSWFDRPDWDYNLHKVKVQE